VTIADRGRAPHPATVAVEYEGGREERHTVPVEHWLEGRSTWALELDEPPVRVRVDPDRRTLDVDPTNNAWISEDG